MRIGHNSLFLFGFIYYLIIPFLIGRLGYFNLMPGMSSWYYDYNNVSLDNLNLYYIFVAVIFVSFYSGSFLLSKFKIEFKRFDSVLYPSKFIAMTWSAVIFIFVCYLTYDNRNALFSGYQSYDKELLGMVGTLNVLIVFFIIHASFEGYRQGLTSYLLIVSLSMSSVFLLSLGSRMYVLIPIIAILIYKTKYSKKPINLYKLIWFGFLAFLLVLSIGIWRMDGSFNFNAFVYILLAEPIFTSWSSVSFLQQTNLPLIAFPYNYLSSILNFIPSFIFPNKVDYIYYVADFYDYDSPLGADSVFVNTVGNFGFLGGAFYFFALGGWYSVLKSISKESNFFKSYYICSLSVLPFQLFRDGFTIVNKQLLWNMFFVPILILFIFNLIRVLVIASYNRKHNF